MFAARAVEGGSAAGDVGTNSWEGLHGPRLHCDLKGPGLSRDLSQTVLMVGEPGLPSIRVTLGESH